MAPAWAGTAQACQAWHSQRASTARPTRWKGVLDVGIPERSGKGKGEAAEGLASLGDELGEERVGGGARGGVAVGHEGGEEGNGGGVGTGMGDGGYHGGDVGVGVAADGERMASKDELELRRYAGLGEVEGFVSGDLVLDLMEPTLRVLDLAKDERDVLGDDEESKRFLWLPMLAVAKGEGENEKG